MQNNEEEFKESSPELLLQEAYELLSANIARQKDLAASLQERMPETMIELHQLQLEQEGLSEKLKSIVKKYNLRIGPVYPRTTYKEFYEPTTFLQLAQANGLLDEMRSLGIVKEVVDPKAADEYLMRFGDLATTFRKQAWVSVPDYQSVYGVPKGPFDGKKKGE